MKVKQPTKVAKENKKENKDGKKESKKVTEKRHRKWVIFITIFAFFLSVFLSFFSDLLMDRFDTFFSFVILIIIILLGIAFDVIGVAVTVADEKPFHSMASAKIKSATDSIKLIRNASRVSNVCNDVVGDICGIISGSSAAFIIIRIGLNFPMINTVILSLLLSGLVASATIGGKAMGKELAMNYSKEIVTWAGKVAALFHK